MTSRCRGWRLSRRSSSRRARRRFVSPPSYRSVSILTLTSNFIITHSASSKPSPTRLVRPVTRSCESARSAVPTCPSSIRIDVWPTTSVERFVSFAISTLPTPTLTNATVRPASQMHLGYKELRELLVKINEERQTRRNAPPPPSAPAAAAAPPPSSAPSGPREPSGGAGGYSSGGYGGGGGGYGGRGYDDRRTSGGYGGGSSYAPPPPSGGRGFEYVLPQPVLVGTAWSDAPVGSTPDADAS